MSDESCVSIEILKEVPFDGEGDTLFNRLRKVSLRGFPDVNIYEQATFALRDFGPGQVRAELRTPQPSVYQDKLDRIQDLKGLFSREGIDILRLHAAYDFAARSRDGTVTEWTMIPPIVERFEIPRSPQGGFDYKPLIGKRLQDALEEEQLGLEKRPETMNYVCNKGEVLLINDGSHRIHFGVERGSGIRFLEVSGMTQGFPYYAAPQHYSSVQVFETREEDGASIDSKVHIVETPGHKHLYRLFPSGGIKSGSVRPDSRLKE